MRPNASSHLSFAFETQTMDQNRTPANRHTWRPAHRQSGPARLSVRRRSMDGVRGESFLVQPVSLEKKPPVQHAQVPKKGNMSASLGSTARRLSLLEEAVRQGAKPQTKSRTGRLRPTKLKFITIVSVLMVLATGYVSIDTWLTNRTVLAQAKAQQLQSTIPPQKAEKEDAAASTASESKRYTLADYKVAPDMPRAIYITKLNMSGRILPMGLKDGAVDAPKNAYDAGWYTGSAKPGATGAALFDGHASEAGGFGLFGNLHKLSNGDVVTVEMGDGTEYDYEIIGKERVAKESVDMTKALQVQGGAEQGATFITCAGKWIEAEQTLSERVLLYAKRI
jgi:LPXTG-site transpeptidase (sortase) family protein